MKTVLGEEEGSKSRPLTPLPVRNISVCWFWTVFDWFVKSDSFMKKKISHVDHYNNLGTQRAGRHPRAAGSAPYTARQPSAPREFESEFQYKSKKDVQEKQNKRANRSGELNWQRKHTQTCKKSPHTPLIRSLAAAFGRIAAARARRAASAALPPD